MPSITPIAMALASPTPGGRLWRRSWTGSATTGATRRGDLGIPGGGRRPFVYGRLMSWVALDRGMRLANAHGPPADIERWRGERDRIYWAIMTKGWNDDLKAFVQYEGSTVLDASILLMPLMGFVTPSDPKWQSTLSAMDRTLVSDSLVYRYDPAASPGGLQGSEGTFSICTFWYVDAAGPLRPA